MEYTWDPIKAHQSLKKHDVDFADAVLVFEDEQALTLEDRDHSEERFITIGVGCIRSSSGGGVSVSGSYHSTDIGQKGRKA